MAVTSGAFDFTKLGLTGSGAAGANHQDQDWQGVASSSTVSFCSNSTASSLHYRLSSNLLCMTHLARLSSLYLDTPEAVDACSIWFW